MQWILSTQKIKNCWLITLQRPGIKLKVIEISNHEKLEHPEGALVVWGGWADIDKQTYNHNKTYLFYLIKNINHSQSYEQSKWRWRTQITKLLQHVHVRVTMYPLTTISCITHSVVNTPMHLYAICMWALVISITTISWHARNRKL